MGEADEVIGSARQIVDLLDRVQRGAQADLVAEQLQRGERGHEARLAEEGDTERLDAALRLPRRLIDGNAEGVQDVADGESRLGADAWLAVEDLRRSRRCGHQRRGRRDDQMSVAPVVRASDVDQSLDRRRNDLGSLADGFDEPGELLGRFALVAFEKQKTARLRRRGEAIEDGRQGQPRLFARERPALCRSLADGAEKRLDGLGVHGADGHGRLLSGRARPARVGAHRALAGASTKYFTRSFLYSRTLKRMA